MKNLRATLFAFITLSVVLGVIYPTIITFVGKVLFPFQANGSLLVVNGDVIGSELIGQNFTLDKYLWGRISATTDEPYNPLASGGANLAPSNPALLDEVKGRVVLLHPTLDRPIPVDLVTSSASGLDPEISIAAAYYQMERIAKARAISENAVQDIINKNAEYPLAGVIGEPRVNVLKVNLALDLVKYEEQK